MYLEVPRYHIMITVPKRGYFVSQHEFCFRPGKYLNLIAFHAFIIWISGVVANLATH